MQPVEVRNYRTVVCRYWLKGLCMLGDNECGFLHVLDESRMPLCKHGKNCKLKHLCKLRHECPLFDQGFCILGRKLCPYRHILKPPGRCMPESCSPPPIRCRPSTIVRPPPFPLDFQEKITAHVSALQCREREESGSQREHCTRQRS
jgi:hypothetical protein